MQTFTDLYKYRFVLTSLVSKNLKVMYRNMALGLVWSLLNPIVMLVTLGLVWTVIFPQEHGFISQTVVALIPYNFAVYCLSGCVHAIPGNAPLVKKIAFPRQILPISIVLTHLIHFAIQAPLIALVLLVFGMDENASLPILNLLWLIPIFIVHVGLCIGVGLLVSALNVLYRDVQYIVDSLLTILFWASPIIYTGEMIARHGPLAYYLYYANPLSGVLSAYRSVLFYGRAPGAETFAMATGITLVIGVFGVLVFWKHERHFADLI